MKPWGWVAAVTSLVVALPILLAAVVASAILPAATAGAACTATTDAGPWRPPLLGTYRVTSGYGMRFHPILQRTKLHTGIDLVASTDRTVVAAAAGTVTTTGHDTAYGNQVVIDHGDGVQTRYGHMATHPAVTVGEHVVAGTRLGTEGQTGYATGIHLHFEVIEHRQPIDPKPFMADHGAPLGGAASETIAAGTTDDEIAAVSRDGQQVRLRGEQVTNAATIIRVGHDTGVPDRGITVALMAALQESGLRNLDHGDRDSVGLFQQRASWGTATERQTPAYAARAFYGGPRGPNRGSPAGLLDLRDWQALGLGQAAQAIQISAYPTRYDRWAPVAQTILARLGGSESGDCAPVGVGTLRVATWNVCLEFCPDLAPWRQRTAVLARDLLATGADVIALQETGRHHPQGDALARALSSRYTVAAYHRSKMILINSDRLAATAVDGRPLPGRGFTIGGRGGVAQVLRFKATGSEIVITSLHPVTGSTPSADQQRLSYVRQAHAIAVNLSDSGHRAIIHTGDLNSYLPGHGTHRAVAEFLKARGFASAEQLARQRDGARFASYNGGHPPKKGRRIDHVLVTRDTTVGAWRQVLADDARRPPSDHHLIVTDLQPPG